MKTAAREAARPVRVSIASRMASGYASVPAWSTASRTSSSNSARPLSIGAQRFGWLDAQAATRRAVRSRKSDRNDQADDTGEQRGDLEARQRSGDETGSRYQQRGDNRADQRPGADLREYAGEDRRENPARL